MTARTVRLAYYCRTHGLDTWSATGVYPDCDVEPLDDEEA